MIKLINYCAGVLISVLCVSFVACNEPKETELQGVDVPFTEYSFAGGDWEELATRRLNVNYVENESNILIINSDEELKKYFEGDYPPVDFSKKTLVLSYGYWSGGFVTEEYRFQQVSDRNYILTCSGLASASLGFMRWYAAIVVDKLPSNSKIELKTVLITIIN